MIKKKRQYLGEMLVNKGLITNEQLQELIEDQSQKKKFLGALLIEKGIISEDDLLQTLAEQFNIDYVSLKDEDIDWNFAITFSSSLVTEHKCLPLRADEDTVMLAITNPLDVWVMDMAEKEAAPRQVQVVLVKSSEMDEAIKEYRKYSIRTMMDKWRKE